MKESETDMKQRYLKESYGETLGKISRKTNCQTEV